GGRGGSACRGGDALGALTHMPCGQTSEFLVVNVTLTDNGAIGGAGASASVPGANGGLAGIGGTGGTAGVAHAGTGGTNGTNGVTPPSAAGGNGGNGGSGGDPTGTALGSGDPAKFQFRSCTIN